MGYRLAAAGPRTRQRLLDRETITADRQPARPFSPEPAEVVEDRLPALSAWDDAAWERRISGEPEPALARLSVHRSGFPVWRAAALLASATCGFSLVLWEQGLHLDHALRHSAARDGKPVVVAGAAQGAAAPPAPMGQTAPPVPSARPLDELSALPALAKPVPQVAGNAAPANVPEAADQHSLAAAAPGVASAAPGVAPPPPQPIAPSSAPVPEMAAAPPAVPLRETAVQPARTKPTRWATPQAAERARAPAAWASAATLRPLPHHAAGGRMVLAEADPKPHGATRAAALHYGLPRWLTDDHPQHAAPLIMSPPPHNLEPPPEAEMAAASPPPVRTAQATLPPIPQPGRRPTVIYAEAHYPPPPPTRPYYNATPYYGGYPQTYGYSSAMPPPTPYGQP